MMDFYSTSDIIPIKRLKQFSYIWVYNIQTCAYKLMFYAM